MLNFEAIHMASLLTFGLTNFRTSSFKPYRFHRRYFGNEH